MKIKHEIISNSDALEFKIFTFKAWDTSFYVPPHWHQSLEFLYCLTGSLEIIIDNEQHLLTPSHACLINSNIVHATHSPEKNMILTIQLPFSFISKLTNGLYGKKFIFSLLPDSITTKNIQLLSQNLSNLSKNTSSISNKLQITSDICLLTKELIDHYRMAITDQEIQQQDLSDKIIQYIQDNYTANPTLSELAKYLNFSDSYCSKIIKQVLGQNFKTLLQSYKLNEANTLLTESTLTLEEIAEQTGFSTYENFYKQFKKAYSISPGLFRKRVRS